MSSIGPNPLSPLYSVSKGKPDQNVPPPLSDLEKTIDSSGCAAINRLTEETHSTSKLDESMTVTHFESYSELSSEPKKTNELGKKNLDPGTSLANKIKVGQEEADSTESKTDNFSTENFEKKFLAISDSKDKKEMFFDEFKKLKNPEHKLKVLEKCIEADHKSVGQNLQLFDLSDSFIADKVGWFLARKDPEDALNLIANKKLIVTEKEKIDIGLFCSETIDVSTYILKLNISDEAVKTQLAINSAKAEISGIADCVENFQIEHEKNRLEVAKVWVQQGGILQLYNFESFNIQNPSFKKEFAMFALEQGNIVEAFGWLCIENEADKIELAWLAATKYPKKTASEFSRFDIREESVRLKFAHFFVQKKISVSIAEFYITDIEERMKVLEELRQNSIPVGRTIKDFGVVDEKIRIEIALADVKQLDITHILELYEIKDESALTQISRECIQRYASNSKPLDWISTLPLSKKRIFELQIFYLKYIPNQYSNDNIKFDTPLYEKYREWILKAPIAKTLEGAENIKEFSSVLSHYIDSKQETVREDLKVGSKDRSFTFEKNEQLNQISKLLKKVEQEKSFQVKYELLSWLAFTVMSLETVEKFDSKLPLEEIFDLRDTQKRYQCLSSLIENVLLPNKLQSYQEISPNTHMKLPALLLIELKGAKKFDRLFNLLKKERNLLRDGATLKQALQAFDVVIRDALLTADEKVEVLLATFESKNKEEIKKNMLSIQSIYLLNKEEELKAASFEFHGKNLDSIMKKMVDTLPFQGQHENLLQSYQETFGSCRQSNALHVYSGMLKEIRNDEEREQAVSAFSVYLDSVLDGSFKDKRYETPHLQKAFNLQDSLKKDWIKGAESVSKDEKLKDLKFVDTDDYWDLLMCGTEVADSCQHVSATTGFNIGLLAYLLDGKNRLIAIKNKEGKVIARSTLRLLIDNKTNKPALMMERVYPNNSNFSSSLEQFAKRRAADLNLDLFTLGVNKVDLESLGGNLAPKEYVDSVEGLCDNGIFQIKSAKLVQKA